MATVPLSGTNIRFLSGVHFHNDYKHTRWFDNLSDQTNWFLNRTVIYQMSQANFQRIEGKNFVAVNRSIDQLHGVSYLMFQNADYNNKWFYAFITKIEYKQRNNTHVHFEIDVLQTWRFQLIMKPSYVVREHCKLWNSDGSPVINTVDEGLNYGTVYDNVKIENYLPHDSIFYLVIAAKQTMHGGTADTPKITPMLNGSPQPLTYYIHPFKLDGTSPTVKMSDMQLNISPVTEVLKALYTQTDAVNNISSLFVTEYIGLNNLSNNELIFSSSSFEHATIQDFDTDSSINTLYLKRLPSYSTMSKNFGNKYDGYNNVKESKLLMYPYTVTVLDDLKGNRIEIKNEHIKSNNLNVAVKGSIGTSNKVSYNVLNYLLESGSENSFQASLENSLINNNPNDVPIITDMLSAYLQGNRNSLENQKNSILFNGTMNAMGSAVGGVASAATRNPIGVASSGLDIVQGMGNTVLQLQGMQAKIQDINNIPPQITKMGGNTAFDFGNRVNGLFIYKKQITSEYRKKLSDFFNMFGYKVNEVKIPNFHTRRHWNYVETSSCNIHGNFNNEDLTEIKSIFDSGITLWHTDDIGNYSLDNEVI